MQYSTTSRPGHIWFDHTNMSPSFFQPMVNDHLQSIFQSSLQTIGEQFQSIRTNVYSDAVPAYGKIQKDTSEDSRVDALSDINEKKAI